MTVAAFQRFHGHAKEACSGPEIDARLHEPCRRRVAQRVRRYAPGIGRQLGKFDTMSEAFGYALNRSAAPLDEIVGRDSKSNPTAQMCQQSRRNRSGRLAL